MWEEFRVTRVTMATETASVSVVEVLKSEFTVLMIPTWFWFSQSTVIRSDCRSPLVQQVAACSLLIGLLSTNR